jgi:hypothetical protein
MYEMSASTLRFRVMGRAATIEEMEEKVTTCLDDVPLLQIRRCVSFLSFFLIISLILIRFANRSARFISAYGEGLTAAQACWEQEVP